MHNSSLTPYKLPVADSGNILKRSSRNTLGLPVLEFKSFN